MERYYKVELRGIDAVRHDGIWTWNDSYVLEQDIYWSEQDLTPRKVLRTLRKWNYLTPSSKGRVRVVEDDEIIEIQEASTGRPLLALLLLKTIQPA